MSDVPLFPSQFDQKLGIESPSISYIAKAVTRNVLFAVKIPCPLLRDWYDYLDKLKKATIAITSNVPKDYTDLLERGIPGHSFCISEDENVRKEIDKALGILAGKVRQAYKKCPGSAKRNKLNNSVKIFHIYEGQTIDVKQLQEENQFLYDELLEWKNSHKNVEEKITSLYEEMQKMTDEKSSLEEVNVELSRYIDELEKSSNMNFKGKDISEVKNKQRTLNAFMSRAKVALWFSKAFGLELESLTLKEVKTGNVHHMSAMEETATQKIQGTPKIDCISLEEKKKIEQILFLLDKFSVGDSFYHELSVNNETLPRSYLIRQRRDQLSNMCHIVPTPGNAEGAQLLFKDLLQQKIKDFLEGNQELTNSSKPLRIKISGDGARMTRNSSYILLSFAILEAGEDVMAAKGNTTIAVIKGSESYNTLKESFKDAFESINDTIAAGKISYDVNLEFFFGWGLQIYSSYAWYEECNF